MAWAPPPPPRQLHYTAAGTRLGLVTGQTIVRQPRSFLPDPPPKPGTPLPAAHAAVLGKSEHAAPKADVIHTWLLLVSNYATVAAQPSIGCQLVRAGP